MRLLGNVKMAAACLLLGALLLGGCKPVTRPAGGLLPTPTPVPIVTAENAPEPPLAGVSFPEESAVIAPVATQPPTPQPTAELLLPQPTPTPEVITGPVTVGIAASVPEEWAAPLLARLNATAELPTANGPQPLNVLAGADNAPAQIVLVLGTQATQPLANRVLGAVAPFATIRDDVSVAELQGRWRDPAGAGPLYVTAEAARWLEGLWGMRAGTVETVTAAEMSTRLQGMPDSLGIVAFEELDPSLKALTVDGANVLSNQFQANRYPLAVTLSVEGVGSSLLAPLLQDAVQPATNRDASQLTQLIMTGVTAMSRVTALRQDQKGYDYPALVISDVFAAADITHISNEVPFLDDCVADPTENNLILCSDTDYWAALAAMGTDIVGLSGNHVNDFGREGARRSLQWYRDNQIPIYGSGMNVDEACAPLLWEDHGNTFAFVAALAFDPPGAWATADQPGACYYYDNKDRILAMVSELAAQVDVVAVELQHQETYEPYPIPLQVAEFRELRAAGADIVTGVMSHVPQAQEPYGAQELGGNGFISYGLGNLFFDQMWSWETRTELAARHTIYAGKLINTELLTMVLEDFAQPRWATPEERADILGRIFAAAPQK
jgi:poly-gamma-glutamate synthesis protein (capsule biosynthesis protein)